MRRSAAWMRRLERATAPDGHRIVTVEPDATTELNGCPFTRGPLIASDEPAFLTLPTGVAEPFMTAVVPLTKPEPINPVRIPHTGRQPATVGFLRSVVPERFGDGGVEAHRATARPLQLEGRRV